MPVLSVTDEQCVETYNVVQKLGSISAAARELGLNRKTVHKHVRHYHARDLGRRYNGLVQPGFEIKSESHSYDGKGNVTGMSVKTQQEGGGEFALPEGHRVKGVSVLTDGQGEERLRWTKTDPEKLTPEKTAELIKAAFEDFKPVAPNIKVKAGIKDRLVVYPILDWHLGMFAWGKETGGVDWDLAIAKKALVTQFAEMVECSPDAHNAVFMMLGDILHSDNSLNRTTRSGNPLDVDTRHGKVIGAAADILAECSEMVARKHKNTIVTCKRGNHDDDSTPGIAQALRMYYRLNKHVKVDTSADPFFWHEFGVNLIGGTHGDRQKLGDLPLVMADRQREAWGRTKSRHMFTGHVHHERSQEVGGVRCWSLRAPIPSDAYHSAVGYCSGRSMYAFNFHAEKGSKGFTEVEIV